MKSCVKIKEIMSSYVNIHKKLRRHKKKGRLWSNFSKLRKKIKRLFFFQTNNIDTLILTSNQGDLCPASKNVKFSRNSPEYIFALGSLVVSI